MMPFRLSRQHYFRKTPQDNSLGKKTKVKTCYFFKKYGNSVELLFILNKLV